MELVVPSSVNRLFEALVVESGQDLRDAATNKTATTMYLKTVYWIWDTLNPSHIPVFAIPHDPSEVVPSFGSRPFGI